MQGSAHKSTFAAMGDDPKTANLLSKVLDQNGDPIVCDNASDPLYQGNEITSPNVSMQKYNKIKASRSRYGSKEFSLNSMYIQSEDAANSLMGWVIDKTMAPRRQMVIETFALPHLQLGDIVTIDYTMPGDIEYVDPTTRFVVQDISYSRALEGPNQSIKVVEII
jgi:hypothetical protein